ncbi:MAG: LysM peptidoglycan-binding domain-containing protein [Blastocatellia bacterium]|nr:LysM peptidoglycan-binding domain-containing protein [Blastocatellia bacterium]
MIIFAGVDGTSAETGTAELPGDYQRSFHQSFVNRLQRNELVDFDDTWYLRGPYTSGLDTAERARACFNWVKASFKHNGAKAVFLGGYSRGAAAVIEVAKWLKVEENIPVECLVLFDAVDRTNTLGDPYFRNTRIVDTVRKVIHPRRNQISTHSRLTFGSCGGTLEDPSKTVEFYKYFFATHGGLGGVPWTKAAHPTTGLPLPTIWEFGEPFPTYVTPARDQAGAMDVWSWTKPHVAYAFHQCKERLAREVETRPHPGFEIPERTMPGGGVGGHVPERGHDGREKRHYIVKSGDWLSKIAEKYYGDMMKYIPLHKANIGVIGPDANKIEPNQKLWIPYPDELRKFK